MTKLYNATNYLIHALEDIVNRYDEIVGEEYENESEAMLCESTQRNLDALVDILRAFRDKEAGEKEKTIGKE